MPLVRPPASIAPRSFTDESLRGQYHSTAAILAVCVGWNAGATVVIGRKFSATRFWRDVRESRANAIQYVGEGASCSLFLNAETKMMTSEGRAVLRYLLATPPSETDKKHEVRLAYGNGCRPGALPLFDSPVPQLAPY